MSATLPPAVAAGNGASYRTCPRSGLQFEARAERLMIVNAVTAVVALAPWQIWVWHASQQFPNELRGSYGPYLDWLVSGYRHEPSLAWTVVWKNTVDLWRAFGVVFAPWLPRVVKGFAAALVFVSLGVGVAALIRRASIVGAFLLAYGAVVLIWPFNPERFVWAVWPFAGLVLLVAARAVGERMSGRWPRAPRLAMGVAVLLLTGHTAYAVRGLANGWAATPLRAMTTRLWPLVEWTAEHAPPGYLIASDAHIMIALYAARTTMPVTMLAPTEYVREKSAAQLVRELDALSVRYAPRLLLLSRDTREREAVALWATQPTAPVVIPLGEIPGGGVAFALRARR